MKYRKKPVVIEAAKVDDFGFIEPMPWWLAEAIENGAVMYQPGYIGIQTLEGLMTANPGDYIIKGVQGELYPCKPDIFEATYDPVEEA